MNLRLPFPLPILATALSILMLCAGCGDETESKLSTEHADPTAGGAWQVEAQDFLDRYTAEYLKLYAVWSEAQWASNTRIVEGDDSLAEAEAAANEVYAAHTGSIEVIGAAQRLLERSEELSELQVRQLERVLYHAAAFPQTQAALTRMRIEAETAQTQALFGFEFRVDGKPVTANEIDRLLRESTDLAERQAVWEASKEVGAATKAGLVRLRDLRNRVVRAFGYDDFYAYQVSAYGMDAAEMNAMMQRLNDELRPLYRELHTWARYELAERYGVPVPQLLPAHWLPNRWGQDWSALIEVEGADVGAALATKTPEWIVAEGEAFYVSLGFDPLPKTFWERSSLYPLPADAAYKKNNHASAWHLDLQDDVRSLMSVEANPEWWETVNHELGHVYYFMSYTRPEVPPLLREGANRAFHEAVGSLMGLAAMQRPFLVGRGLLEADVEVDETALLLRDALSHAAFIAFGAGTMPFFEHALYAEELPPEEFNAKWWELARRFQGIEPPTPRGEEHADGLSKTHIHNDPAQYYDYALSTVLLFQLHDHISREILHQDPRAADYWDSKATGEFLRGLLEPGETRDWRELTIEATGSELTAAPMLAYFQPLMEWLQEQNQGRTHTLQ